MTKGVTKTNWKEWRPFARAESVQTALKVGYRPSIVV